ncbi:unnamed protein product [Triticum turgidum subsp. durum]|uniref:Beta-amylase n=1 Tax=Triticum turgidum subsp. durum TaxID=4567 RepID=A0A9R1PFR6_TRITD|nr:unnamed protein product [Triticum turgidum subsp. durum]
MSPLQRYEAFFRSFVDAFDDLFESTITDVTVGLGPNGELRYPSYPPGSDVTQFIGVGEFQCYDKYMLAQLRQHAEALGNPLWGLAGPHDAPGSFSRIKSNIVTAERMKPTFFTYRRMGAEFFSPEHWSPFMEFVRTVVCGEWDEDDETAAAVSSYDDLPQPV